MLFLYDPAGGALYTTGHGRQCSIPRGMSEFVCLGYTYGSYIIVNRDHIVLSGPWCVPSPVP